ncbi:MAG: FAD-binding oxidoreductase [Aphanocapsa sp. GSE-SYN-MK-11-07L]|jgi:FAD/FMN-containing dehydrogenase|nr:FAD-binding oxidoreductase [Aphanocapsa sp. GSE-SYN-MK-11-07L]
MPQHNLPIRHRLKAVVLIPLAAMAIALAVVSRPALHLALTAWNDQDQITPLPTGMVDDASRLNPTRMQIVQVPNHPVKAKALLRNLLQQAKIRGQKVAIAGARHTMGGQTIYAKGISLDMTGFNRMQLNPTTGILTVQSGAKWSKVIPYLNQQGYSVAVMQSNNDFSVGGTMNANAHGWQPDRPPFASTVESFELMLADGRIVQCSRQTNRELFSLVLGGYGLFGIILEVKLRVVPNQLYSAERTVIPSRDYVETYRRAVTKDVGMAYGRLSIAPDRFLQEAILTTYHRQTIGDRPLPLTESQPGIARTVFRGSVGNDYGKNLRWQLEKLNGGEVGTHVTRNQILNRPSSLFENYKQAETEILHEYFIPPESLELFLEQCRVIIPKHQADLLSVTVRNVYPDQDSFLRYADQEMFGLVMLFHQQRTAADEVKMQVLTQALIEAALAVGGRYYLPYRLHATPSQFDRAYPQATKFFQLKQKYDSNLIFDNYFYTKYGR